MFPRVGLGLCPLGSLPRAALACLRLPLQPLCPPHPGNLGRLAFHLLLGLSQGHGGTRFIPDILCVDVCVCDANSSTGQMVAGSFVTESPPSPLLRLCFCPRVLPAEHHLSRDNRPWKFRLSSVPCPVCMLGMGF